MLNDAMKRVQIMTKHSNLRPTAMARALLLAVASLTVVGASAQIPERAEWDTLDARHDKSRPLRERFRITANHIWAEWNTGNFKATRAGALELMDMAEEADSDSLRWRAYSWASGGFGESGDLGARLKYLYKGLEFAQAVNDTSGFTDLYKNIGLVYKWLKDYRHAIEHFKKAASYARFEFEINRASCHLSDCYLGLGLVDSALYFAQRSNIVTAPSLDAYGYARSQLVLGRAYAAKGDEEQADVFLRRCIQTCDSFQVILPMAQAMIAQGEAFLKRGIPDGAIQSGRSAMEIALSAGHLSEAIASADLIHRSYWLLGNGDSAYVFQGRMVALQDSLSSAKDLNKVQNVAFEQQLKEREDAKLRAEEVAARSRNIQFGIIALIVITLGIFLLVFSRTAVVGARAIKNLSLIALLLFFEFINLLVHPFLGELTHHSPILMLLCMAAIAGLLIPLHHRMEHLITNMLVSKNNRVRLEAARRTIEELEARPTDTNAG